MAHGMPRSYAATNRSGSRAIFACADSVRKGISPCSSTPQRFRPARTWFNIRHPRIQAPRRSGHSVFPWAHKQLIVALPTRTSQLERPLCKTGRANGARFLTRPPYSWFARSHHLQDEGWARPSMSPSTRWREPSPQPRNPFTPGLRRRQISANLRRALIAPIAREHPVSLPDQVIRRPCGERLDGQAWVR